MFVFSQFYLCVTHLISSWHQRFPGNKQGDPDETWPRLPSKLRSLANSDAQYYIVLKSSTLERSVDQCTSRCSTTVQLGSRTIQQCIWVHLTAAFLTLLFVWKSLIEAPVAFVPRPKKGRCRFPGESLCSRISWQKRIYWHTKKDILEELPSLGECSYNCSDKLWYR